MKTAKKLSILVSFVLCLVLLFSSCGLSSLIDKDKINTPQWAEAYTASQVSAIEGYEEIASSEEGNLLFGKNNEDSSRDYLVYNLAENKSVFTKHLAEDEVANFSIDLYGDLGFIYVTETDDQGDTLHTLYLPSGERVFNQIDEFDVTEAFINDCVVWKNNVLRYDEKTGAKIKEYTRSALLGSIPQCDSYNSEYYYAENSNYADTLAIFDSEYNLITTYNAPSYSEETRLHYYSDGKVVVQYLTLLPDDAKDYDLFYENDKYDLSSIQINPQNGSLKELDLDYMLYGVFQTEDDERSDVYKDSVTDLAALVKIEDKMMDAGEGGIAIYATNSKGKLKGPIFESNGTKVATLMTNGNGYILAATATGIYILDEKGEVVGRIATNDFPETTEKYILADDGIYDFALNKKVDLYETTYKDYEHISTMSTAFLFEQTLDEATEDGVTTRYYLYANDAFKEIATNLTYDSNSLISYTLTNDSDEYVVYDTNGTELMRSKYTISSVTYRDNVYLYRTLNDDGVYVYYRLAPR